MTTDVDIELVQDVNNDLVDAFARLLPPFH